MKKILFGVAALGLLGLAGAGIGLKAQNTIEAKAAVDYYLRGTPFGWDSFSEANKFVATATPNEYKLAGISLSKDQEFKIGAESWSNGDWGAGTFNGGSGRGGFTLSAGDKDNVTVAVTGTYDFYLNTSEGKVYVNYVDSDPSSYTPVYLSFDNEDLNHAYLFDSVGGKDSGDFPGLSNGDFNMFEKVSGVHVDGQALYKLKVTAQMNAIYNTIILDNGYKGMGNQTANLSLPSVATYYKSDASTVANGPEQVQLILDIQAAISAATNSSVCNIDSATASGLVTRYAGLADKSIIDDAEIYTWAGKEYGPEAPESYRQISGEDGIMEKLSAVSSGANVVSPISSEGNSIGAIAGIIGISFVVVFGGFLFIRKKKEQE